MLLCLRVIINSDKPTTSRYSLPALKGNREGIGSEEDTEKIDELLLQLDQQAFTGYGQGWMQNDDHCLFLGKRHESNWYQDHPFSNKVGFEFTVRPVTMQTLWIVDID
ncbi:uncharacterized protein LOC132607203 isoform X2 [Lycium barbarum]|uniref:uncharacterized protein LOC132607203 isoform X2 n=1 Tax=Lycium barbarum TaxID=112863 RepID=UPI00293F5384|nr:uncharacterized protein LOC132607203 isoform X2 [Lycium barbarum]